MKTNCSNTRTRIRELLAGLAMLACAHTSFAASTWDPLSTNCGASGGFSAGNVLDCGTGVTSVGDPAVKLTADAFSTADNSAGSAFAKAFVNNSGAALGVQASAGDDAAIDNAGSTDAIRLTFTNAAGTQDANFNLASITVTSALASGFSLLQWVGLGPSSSTSLTGVTVAGLATAGWSLVGYYEHIGGASTTINLVTSPSLGPGTGGMFSSQWLVSAYNTSFGFTPGTPASNFTITALSGSLAPDVQFKPGQVPEPGSLALFGIALAGMAAVRRRQNARA